MSKKYRSTQPLNSGIKNEWTPMECISTGSLGSFCVYKNTENEDLCILSATADMEPIRPQKKLSKMESGQEFVRYVRGNLEHFIFLKEFEAVSTAIVLRVKDNKIVFFDSNNKCEVTGRIVPEFTLRLSQGEGK